MKNINYLITLKEEQTGVQKKWLDPKLKSLTQPVTNAQNSGIF